MNREEIIVTATRISEIRRKLTEMKALEEELARLEATLDSLSSVSTTTKSTRRRSGSSIEDRVYDFLQEHRARDWSAEEIAHELHVKVPTTRAAFSRLRGAEKVRDTSRGRVQAKNGTDQAKKEESSTGLLAA